MLVQFRVFYLTQSLARDDHDVPTGQQMLVAREARGQGRYRKSFEVVRLDGLTTERVTGDVAALPLFQRWQDPAWKRQTLSLR